MKNQERKSKTKAEEFLDYVNPNYLVFCNDAVLGQDGSVSLFRMVDSFTPFHLPLTPTNLYVIVEFRRNHDIPIDVFNAADLYFDLVLESPTGEKSILAFFRLAKIAPESAWNVARIVISLSHRIGFKHSGDYIFKAVGRVGEHGKGVDAIQNALFINPATDISGSYTWESIFESDKQTGIANISDEGAVNGQGNGFTLQGTYTITNRDMVAMDIGLKKTGSEHFATQIIAKGPHKEGKIELVGISKSNAIERGYVILKKIMPTPKTKERAPAGYKKKTR
jgi:hypothetical protein